MKKKSYLAFVIIIIVLVAGTSLFVVNYFSGFLNPLLDSLNKLMPQINSMVFRELVAGISVGTFIFIGVLLVFPFVSNNLDVKIYFKEFLFGLLSALVFFLSDALQKLLKHINSVYILLILLGVIIMTWAIIEIIAALFLKKAAAVEFRSQTIAGILAGILFSIIVNLVKMGLSGVTTKNF